MLSIFPPVAHYGFRLGLRRMSAAGLCALLLAAAACDAPIARHAGQDDTSNAAKGESPSAGRPHSRATGQRETWDVQLMRGVKMGYTHTVRRPIQEGDQRYVEIEMTMKLGVARAGEANDQHMRLASVETPDGRLVRFRSEADLGSGPIVVTGRVHDGKLELSQKGVGGSQQIDWPADAVGFSGIEASLRDQPLHPGERREFTVFVPFLNHLAHEELMAGDYEKTTLLSGERELLRVEATTRMQGDVTLRETQWIDDQGEPIKTRMASADQESYRVTREVALATPTGDKLDLIHDLVVPLKLPAERALTPPLDARPQASYRVTLGEDNPATVFASGATQQVVPLDPRMAQIVVWRAGPGHLPARADLPAEAAPGPEYLASSSLVQCDDENVKELAASVASGPPGSAERARELAAAVYKMIGKKNFTQAFASAAEVACRREGDCTEHSVLLTAIARASGIPARVVVGLVYVDGLRGFGFHMWNEVFVDGQWLPLDATFGAEVGPGHLKLTDSAMAQGSEFTAFLSVARVLGQLKIELEP